MIWRWHFGRLGFTGKQETPMKWSLALWKSTVDNFLAHIYHTASKNDLSTKKYIFSSAYKMWGTGVYPAVFCINTDRQLSPCYRPLHLVSHFSRKTQKCWGSCWCGKLFKENTSTRFPETGSHIRIQLPLINFSVSLLSHLACHMMDLNCQCTCYFVLHCGSQQLCPQGQSSWLAAFLYCMYSKPAHLIWCYQIKPDCNVCLRGDLA